MGTDGHGRERAAGARRGRGRRSRPARRRGSPRPAVSGSTAAARSVGRQPPPARGSTASVNSPGWPVTPTSACGPTALTTSSSETWPSSSASRADLVPWPARSRPGSRADRRGRCAAGRRGRRASIDAVASSMRQPGGHERAGGLAGDADAGGAGADDHHPQVDSTGVPLRRMPPTIAATATAAVPWMSSLNEQISVAMAGQQSVGVALGEVLPLQQHVRAAVAAAQRRTRRRARRTRPARSRR